MERVLVISDDPSLRERLRLTLERAGYAPVLRGYDGLEEQDAFSQRLEAALVDLVTSPSAGKGACQTLRSQRRTSTLPILALTTLEGIREPEWALLLDDFILEPHALQELAARLRLLIARRNGLEAPGVLHLGDVTIDQAKYEVRLRGALLDLTLKEYELLTYLAQHRGRVFSRETLLNRVWGYDYYGGTRTVDVHIRRLRAKLQDEDETLIQTVRGVGYKMAS